MDRHGYHISSLTEIQDEQHFVPPNVVLPLFFLISSLSPRSVCSCIRISAAHISTCRFPIPARHAYCSCPPRSLVPARHSVSGTWRLPRHVQSASATPRCRSASGGCSQSSCALRCAPPTGPSHLLERVRRCNWAVVKQLTLERDARGSQQVSVRNKSHFARHGKGVSVGSRSQSRRRTGRDAGRKSCTRDASRCRDVRGLADLALRRQSCSSRSARVRMSCWQQP